MHAFGVAWNESTETPGNRNETALVWIAYLSREPVASLDFSSRFFQSWDTFLDQSWDNGKVGRKDESRNNYSFINEIVEEEIRNFAR